MAAGGSGDDEVAAGGGGDDKVDAGGGDEVAAGGGGDDEAAAGGDTADEEGGEIEAAPAHSQLDVGQSLGWKRSSAHHVSKPGAAAKMELGLHCVQAHEPHMGPVATGGELANGEATDGGDANGGGGGGGGGGEDMGGGGEDNGSGGGDNVIGGEDDGGGGGGGSEDATGDGIGDAADPIHTHREVGQSLGW